MSGRADAARNRELLLDAALSAFTTTKAPTLEAIAREAGVGIGTLYRHFPTREALVEAVYRSELEALCERVPKLLRTKPADVALRSWMGAYADFVSTKREMGEALRQVITSGAITSGQTRARIGGAIGELLRAGSDQGVLRPDVRPEDVTAALAGVVMSAAGPSERARRAQVRRLLDLLLDGLRQG